MINFMERRNLIRMRTLILNGVLLFVVISILTRCKKGSSPDPLPAAYIVDVVQDRTTGSSIFHFTVSLTGVTTKTVTIHYSTVAGTAAATTDFIPVTGTLTIPANQQQGFIDVTVTGDSLRKTDQDFYVQLDNPQNCTL